MYLREIALTKKLLKDYRFVSWLQTVATFALQSAGIADVLFQDQLSGTEDELDKLRNLIEQLNKEGADKNKELEQLQKLLEQLQEQAAMRDFVLANLDEKANKVG